MLSKLIFLICLLCFLIEYVSARLLCSCSFLQKVEIPLHALSCSERELSTGARVGVGARHNRKQKTHKCLKSASVHMIWLLNFYCKLTLIDTIHSISTKLFAHC